MIIQAIIHNQKGAMFGLDARIALAIFGALSLIAGSYTALTMADIYANSFSRELEETGRAIEAIHTDLKMDLHKSLKENTNTNAFVALYDKEVLQHGKARGRWLGPYIRTSSPVHPRYGEVRITKRASQTNQTCYPETTCYLWLSYSSLPKKVSEKLNNIFDGREELEPETTGRIQWADGYNDGTHVLWYRASQTLGGSGYN